jgi:hypothetical protein
MIVCSLNDIFSFIGFKHFFHFVTTWLCLSHR